MGAEQVVQRVRAMAVREAERMLSEAMEATGNSQADLRDIELLLRERVLSLGGRILEESLAASGPGYEGSRRDCPCGGRQHFVGYRPKQMMTLLSDITVERAYYHCPRCGRGWIPFDRRWDVVGTGFSPAFREAVTALGAEVAFQPAGDLLHRLCGVRISKERIEQITEGYGEQIGQYHEQLCDHEVLLQKSDKVEDLYIEVDGTTVHLEEGWKEVKLGTIFWAEIKDRPIRGPTTYLGGFVRAEQLGEALWGKVDQIDSHRVQRQVVLGDGAPWIWNLADLHFPSAIQIIDWYHATEYLWNVARAMYGEDSPRVAPWARARESELWQGDVEALLHALARLRPRSRNRQKVVQLAKNYFHNHRERMRYGSFRRQGLFIGSGVVEGSCKHIVGDRLKKAGMRWSKPGATYILNLRLCILNNQWEDFRQWRRSQLLNAA